MVSGETRIRNERRAAAAMVETDFDAQYHDLLHGALQHTRHGLRWLHSLRITSVRDPNERPLVLSFELTPPRRRMLILMVEDEPLMVDLMLRLCQRRGLHVELVSVWEGGLGLYLCKALHPELVISGMLYPDALPMLRGEAPGVAFLRHLKRRSDTRSIPVLFWTALARARPDLTAQALKWGAIGVLDRLCGLDVLEQSLRQQVLTFEQPRPAES